MQLNRRPRLSGIILHGRAMHGLQPGAHEIATGAPHMLGLLTLYDFPILLGTHDRGYRRNRHLRSGGFQRKVIVRNCGVYGLATSYFMANVMQATKRRLLRFCCSGPIVSRVKRSVGGGGYLGSSYLCGV